MNLLIDIGNTNITVGTFVDGNYSLEKPIKTKNFKEENFPKKLLNLIADAKFIGVSSVVPRVNEKLRNFLPQEKTFYINHSNFKSLIDIDYETPDTLGADRIVNCFATKILYGFPSIVVDIGSAITIDLINSKGIFIGGVIFAGPITISEALSQKAEKLFKINISEITQLDTGKSSKMCLEMGIYFSTLYAIKGFVENYRKILGKNSKLILTGGISHHFKDHLPEFKYEKLLTLKGINLAIEKWAR